MDGFDSLGRTKLIMATNRPDTLDPALLRPGRLDRKIEIPLPNEQARLEILKIHSAPVNKSGDIDYEAIVKLSDGFNGADLRNVVTEAGMFAIRDDRCALWTTSPGASRVLIVLFAGSMLSRRILRRQLARSGRRRSTRVSPLLIGQPRAKLTGFHSETGLLCIALSIASVVSSVCICNDGS